MSLDLAGLVPQVKQMGQALAERSIELQRIAATAQRAFKVAAAADPMELRRKIDRAGERWPGAIPTDEPIAQTYPPPSLPERLHVLAADGSQIYPDRHAQAMYFMINIGSIHIIQGSGWAPSTASTPKLYYQPEELYGDEEGLVTVAIINGRRDTAEIAELARLAHACNGEPTLGLLDNSLLLWLALQARDQERKEAERILQSYLVELDRLREQGAAVAGVVDRPRSANVLALLHLAKMPPERINQASLHDNPFRGLTDRSLLDPLLPPLHRTACFIHASPLNQRFRESGHEVQFFYLNLGPEGQTVRVEIPAWVAHETRLLALVHAGLVDQSRTTGGFPYALVRAHELAVLGQAERQSFEEMLTRSLLDQGLSGQRSLKDRTKRWTGQRRRHRL